MFNEEIEREQILYRVKPQIQSCINHS